MTSIICPCCGAENSSKYNFCMVCDKQMRCLSPNCKEILVCGKNFCLVCGQTLATTSRSETPLNKYFHKVKQDGKNYEEHTELSITDHSVSELAPFIGPQMTLRSSHKPYPATLQNASTISPQKAVAPNKIFAESQEFQQLPATANANDRIQQVEPVNNDVSRYFEADGDFLIATVKDFKGKTWADQQRNFILLYAWAYYQFFNKPVPSKDHFKNAAHKASVLDPTNFTKYLNELTRKYLSEIGGGYKLNHDGEKEVKHIISLMQDDNVDGGYEYWGRSISATKRLRHSKEDKDKLKEWVQEDIELGKLEVCDIKKPRDYAMVALWIIISKLKKAKAMPWNDAYYFFKEKFETISVTPQAFSRAMDSPKNTKYFRKTGDQYYLSSEGQQKVEAWIAGTPFESQNETEEETDN